MFLSLPNRLVGVGIFHFIKYHETDLNPCCIPCSNAQQNNRIFAFSLILFRAFFFHRCWLLNGVAGVIETQCNVSNLLKRFHLMGKSRAKRVFCFRIENWENKTWVIFCVAFLLFPIFDCFGFEVTLLIEQLVNLRLRFECAEQIK